MLNKKRRVQKETKTKKKDNYFMHAQQHVNKRMKEEDCTKNNKGPSC